MDNPNQHFFIFECDYATRTKEAPFLKAIFDSFDKNVATVVALIVNNNIYQLEFHIGVNIKGSPTEFEAWLQGNFPTKVRRHDLYLHELTRHGNFVTLLNSQMVDNLLTEEASFPFLLPERKIFEGMRPANTF